MRISTLIPWSRYRQTSVLACASLVLVFQFPIAQHAHLLHQSSLLPPVMSSTQLEAPSRELPASEEYTVPDQEVVISLNGGGRVLHPSFTPTTASSSFCVQWDDINTDDWWTHHPEYTTTHENATHTCFSYIKNDATRLFYQRLHDNQFFGNCSVTQTRHMWSSGWGSDMSNLVYGLLKGLEDQTPFAVGFLAYKPWWHYAANKKVRTSLVCHGYATEHFGSQFANYFLGCLQRDMPTKGYFLLLFTLDELQSCPTTPNQPKASRSKEG